MGADTKSWTRNLLINTGDLFQIAHARSLSGVVLIEYVHSALIFTFWKVTKVKHAVYYAATNYWLQKSKLI